MGLRPSKIERNAQRVLQAVEVHAEDVEYTGADRSEVGPARVYDMVDNTTLTVQTYQQSWETAPRTLEIAAAIKFRLGTVSPSTLNVKAAEQEGRDYIRRQIETDPKWKDMRVTDQQRFLTYAVQLVFVPNQSEIHAARLARSRTWRKAVRQRDKGSTSCSPFCLCLPLCWPFAPKPAKLRESQLVQA